MAKTDSRPLVGVREDKTMAMRVRSVAMKLSHVTQLLVSVETILKSGERGLDQERQVFGEVDTSPQAVSCECLMDIKHKVMGLGLGPVNLLKPPNPEFLQILVGVPEPLEIWDLPEKSTDKKVFAFKRRLRRILLTWTPKSFWHIQSIPFLKVTLKEVPDVAVGTHRSRPVQIRDVTGGHELLPF